MPIDHDNKFIEIRDLHLAFGQQKIHQGVDLKVFSGETMVIIGGSGEGKSVLLRQILGIIRPDQGSIKIDGEEITTLSERQMATARRKVGILFQNGALFDSMSVEQNVAFPLIQSGVKDRKLITDRVHECLDVVDLAEHKKKMPVHLSGGMRKRVALARAIVNEPRCVLYDEPTAGLDPIVSDSINILIRRLQERLGVTSIVVTHDMKSVFHVADRVAYLKGGQIYFRGTRDDLKSSKDPQIINFIEGISEGHIDS